MVEEETPDTDNVVVEPDEHHTLNTNKRSNSGSDINSGRSNNNCGGGCGSCGACVGAVVDSNISGGTTQQQFTVVVVVLLFPPQQKQIVATTGVLSSLAVGCC